MQLLSLALPPLVLVFLQLSPALAQSNITIATSSTSPQVDRYPAPITMAHVIVASATEELSQSALEPLPGTTLTPGEISSRPRSTMTQMIIASATEELSQSTLEPLPATTLTPGEVSSGPRSTMTQMIIASATEELSQSALEPLPGTTLTPGEVSSGPRITMAQLTTFPSALQESSESALETGGGVTPVPQASDGYTEPYLEPSPRTTLTPGEVSSGPSDTMAQIPISNQDQKSVTSNPVVTVPQPSINPATHNSFTQSTSSILQQASSSSSPAIAVIQIPNGLTAQSNSPIDHESSSSLNINIPPTSLPHLPSKMVPHTTTSMDYQTSSSSSFSSNRNPFQTLPSDSMLTDHPPAQNIPAPTLVGVPVPTAVQTVLLEVIISSTAGLGDAILAGMGILPPEASATPGEVANAAIESVSHGVEVVEIFPTTTLIVATVSSVPTAATSAVEPIVLISAGMDIPPPEASATPGEVAIESGGNGIEVVQIFPTTTLIVSTVSSVPAAATSAVERPIVLISAGTGIVPSGTSATLGEPANGAIQSGGNGGGGGHGSSVVTGSSSSTGSGSGNPTESGSGPTNVPIVSTGGAEGVTRCESWWLEFGILVWGVGMVYWMS